MKTLAFYLPQFHAIPENDEWWGKGFTEWVNVKKAKPSFPGHNQPEVPTQGYYNLLDPQVMRNQAQMAKKYGIDGFCYYHYWFQGKLLLEKPLENMLKDETVDIPFCFCWANENWTRTWDGLEKHVLISQNYDENWNEMKQHFDYLLPFFKDERYIKHEGKPIIIIYKPFLIQNIEEQIACWNALAQEVGFPGLYWGFQYPESFEYSHIKEAFDFGIEFEPLYSSWESSYLKAGKTRSNKIKYGLTHPTYLLNVMIRKLPGLPKFMSYRQTWHAILNRKYEQKHMPGAFPAWDNTPRRGRSATVWYGASPKLFSKYLSRHVARVKKEWKAEYLFINAWNEWAEGAHLEPDEHNGYAYLEAVKKAVQE